MTGVAWSMVDVALRLLERNEREVVHGDLAEAGDSAWRGMLDVLGLVFRRQVSLWKSWRPWLAACGVTLPFSFLLMGMSVSVSRAYQQSFSSSSFEPLPLLCLVFLLVAWAWVCGFVVGSVSKRTIWVSAALCAFPCLFCLSRFRIGSMSRYCLLLFLLPAAWGVWQGLRSYRLRIGPAIVLAMAMTILLLPTWSHGGQHWWDPARLLLNSALSWPAWYIVATARRSG
jgi:hypothetical protein